MSALRAIPPVEEWRGGRARPAMSGDKARELEQELQRSIEGEVRFDAGSRALYAMDSSNYRQVPIGVVIPKSIDDVISTVALCRKFNAPLLSRGGGTSLAGQCCNTAIVMDWTKYLGQILEIDPARRTATVPRRRVRRPKCSSISDMK